MKNKNNIFKDNIPEGFHQSVPSKNFTDNVMTNIKHSLETKTVFTPLISKKWWKIIGTILISILTLSFIFESQTTLPNFFSDISFPSFEDYKNSIQLTGIILIMLILLTASDLIYRKYKHIT